MARITPERLEGWRRTPGFKIWSRKIVSLWNRSVELWGKRKVTEEEFDELESIRNELEDLRKRVRGANFFRIPVDPDFIGRAKRRDRLDYFLKEGDSFEDVYSRTKEVLDEAELNLLKRSREYISVAGPSGRKIYRDKIEEDYEVYRKKLEEYRSIEEVEKKEEKANLRVVWKASIETPGGNEPFAAEITGTTVVNMNRKDLMDLCRSNGRLEKAMEKYVKKMFDKTKLQTEESYSRGQFLHNKIQLKSIEDVTMKKGAGFSPTNTRQTSLVEVYAKITNRKRKPETDKERIAWK